MTWYAAPPPGDPFPTQFSLHALYAPSCNTYGAVLRLRLRLSCMERAMCAIGPHTPHSLHWDEVHCGTRAEASIRTKYNNISMISRELNCFPSSPHTPSWSGNTYASRRLFRSRHPSCKCEDPAIHTIFWVLWEVADVGTADACGRQKAAAEKRWRQEDGGHQRRGGWPGNDEDRQAL